MWKLNAKTGEWEFVLRGSHGLFEGEDDGGGGSGEPPPFDLQKVLGHPTTKAALHEWAEREIASGLKAKNGELLGKLAKFKIGEKDENGQKVAVFLDPEEAKAALEKVKTITDQPNVKDEVTRALAEAQSRFDAQLNAMKAEVTTYKDGFTAEVQKRHGMLLENALKGHLLESGIKPAKAPLHEMFLRQFLKIEIDPTTQAESIVVVDDKKAVRYGKNGAMGVGEFIEEYKVRDGIAEDWLPNTNRGSGTQPNERGGRNVTIDPSLSPEERLKAFRRAGGGARR